MTYTSILAAILSSARRRSVSVPLPASVTHAVRPSAMTFNSNGELTGAVDEVSDNTSYISVTGTLTGNNTNGYGMSEANSGAYVQLDTVGDFQASGDHLAVRFRRNTTADDRAIMIGGPTTASFMVCGEDGSGSTTADGYTVESYRSNGVDYITGGGLDRNVIWDDLMSDRIDRVVLIKNVSTTGVFRLGWYALSSFIFEGEILGWARFTDWADADAVEEYLLDDGGPFEGELILNPWFIDGSEANWTLLDGAGGTTELINTAGQFSMPVHPWGLYYCTVPSGTMDAHGAEQTFDLAGSSYIDVKCDVVNSFNTADFYNVTLEFQDSEGSVISTETTTVNGNTTAVWRLDAPLFTFLEVPAGATQAKLRLLSQSGGGDNDTVGFTRASAKGYVGSTVSAGLLNGGFETGDLTGWNTVSGTWTVETQATNVNSNHALDGPDNFPRTGTYAIWANTTTPNEIDQTVDLSGVVTDAKIDASEVYALAEAWVEDTFGDGDYGQISIEFLDSADSVISTVSSGTASAESYTRASITEVLPVDTRKINLRVLGIRLDGSLCNVGIDDVSLDLFVVESEEPQINLVNSIETTLSGTDYLFWHGDDETTVYQNTSATTPATAAGQDVQAIDPRGNLSGTFTYDGATPPILSEYVNGLAINNGSSGLSNTGGATDRGTQQTFFAVVDADDFTASGEVIFQIQNTGGLTGFTLNSPNATDLLVYSGNSVTATRQASGVSLFVVRRNGATTEIWENGALLNSGNAGLRNTSDNRWIHQNYLNAEVFTGKSFCHIYVNETLDDTTKTSIENTLMNFYGIS